MSKVRELAEKVQHDIELRREAYSMSLYVSIVLLSALAVFDESHPPDHREVFFVELGTTVGLVLAHAFAVWVSAKITADDENPLDSWDLLFVQLGGALAVASVAMLAVVIAPASVELQVARLTVAGTIGIQVFVESRASNSTARSAMLGLLALGAGVLVATIKSLLVH